MFIVGLTIQFMRGENVAHVEFRSGVRARFTVVRKRAASRTAPSIAVARRSSHLCQTFSQKATRAGRALGDRWLDRATQALPDCVADPDHHLLQRPMANGTG